MSQNVKGLIKQMKQTVKQLEKLDGKTEVQHILCPDGGYSGDNEDTFTKITIDPPGTDEDGEEVNFVTMWLHY